LLLEVRGMGTDKMSEVLDGIEIEEFRSQSRTLQDEKIWVSDPMKDNRHADTF
jgi:hypothetical protein